MAPIKTSKVQCHHKYSNVDIAQLLVDDKCIGLYLLARQQDQALCESEEVWLEQFSEMIASVIRDSRKKIKGCANPHSLR